MPQCSATGVLCCQNSLAGCNTGDAVHDELESARGAWLIDQLTDTVTHGQYAHAEVIGKSADMMER